MGFEHVTRGDIEILGPVGRLDSNSSPELERTVVELLDAGCTRMVFDLADMDYISSAGLRVILLAGKKLRTQQGKLALCGLRANVRDVFEMSGFLSLFPVTGSLDEALAKV